MNLTDMQALVAVIETGSLARAAVKLNLTQPAITRRIQRLEESLGAPLLNRDVKPARPTAEGESAYAECLRVLSAADGLKSAVAGEPRPGRTLRIGVSLGSADLALPAMLPAPPGTGQINVETGRSVSLEAATAEGRFDAALVLRHVGREADPAEKIAHIRVRIVAPLSIHLPRRVRLKDLRGKRWVLCPDGCGYRRALEHGLYGAAQPLDIVAAIWGFDAQARLVAAGVGLGLLPERTIEALVSNERLQVLDVADFSAALDLCLVRGPDIGSVGARIDALRLALRQFFSVPVRMAS